MFTSIPCIAFDNASGKIGEGYKWIRNNQYIKFVTSIEEFKEEAVKLDVNRKYSFDNSTVDSYYYELECLIKTV